MRGAYSKAEDIKSWCSVTGGCFYNHDFAQDASDTTAGRTTDWVTDYLSDIYVKDTQTLITIQMTSRKTISALLAYSQPPAGQNQSIFKPLLLGEA